MHVLLCIAYNAVVMWQFVPLITIFKFSNLHMHVCVRRRAGSTRASSMKTANAYGWPECQIPRHSVASVIRLSCARVFYIQSSKPDARNSARNSTNPRIREFSSTKLDFTISSPIRTRMYVDRTYPRA